MANSITIINSTLVHRCSKDCHTITTTTTNDLLSKYTKFHKMELD